ncbi:Fe-only nitrogenase accessory protein AnfO [Magnetospirillum molischianum]|uniref:Fe-only nitrogenase accessory protein AnfO n=1 Tax=Magnetospirillum molischianum DSM 120 TaxID=1150626 RepID=H8FST3_MAGML|nr:Fe-only nitrogenase accessory protein AnfO [Magnetospirillum molischianum]CCG41421.1 conserved hypothetical protein [Magnetospirillum molischianum DSM 120]
MKIAACIDEAGTVSTLDRPGSVCLFGREATGWVEQDRIAFDLAARPTLALRKEALRDLAIRLGDCRVLLAAGVTGIVPAILQGELGFRIWRSQGELTEQLDHVATREAEAAEAAAVIAAPELPAGSCCSSRCSTGCTPATDTAAKIDIAPEQIGRPEEGRLRIDLAACLAGTSGLNSRDILVPILTGPPFRSLEILCDHPPRWLAETVAGLGLIASIEATPKSGIRVTVTPR